MAEKNEFVKLVTIIFRLIVTATFLFFLLWGFLAYYRIDPNLSAFKSGSPITKIKAIAVDPNRIENGIHVRTGLKDAKGLMTVVQNCTNCHSSKLVTQNRMNTENWNATIKWMQETQNLWFLGENQEVIVNYLVTNYPPIKKGRREKLSNIDWYELED